ncbi:hypothetical protein DBR42_02380 [Pelomonas sp. HMWF004]|nr:hypothetical protein DBR42_02380 [Pelomonas sp. HMWF004]
MSLPLWIWVLPVAGTHDTARLSQLALLLLLAVTAIRSPAPPARSWEFWIAVAWGLAACAAAAKPTVAVRECVLLFGLVFLAGRVAQLPSPQRLQILRALVVVGLAHSTIFCINLVAVATLDGSIDPFQLVFGFDNPRHLNHTQTVLVPLALWVATRDDEPRWRLAGMASAALSLVVASFLMGRATMLALTLALVAAALLWRRAAWPYLRPAIACMTFGIGVGFAFLVMFGADLPGEVAQTGSWEARLQLWRAAIADASQSLFGVGPMHFSRVPRGDAAHPHSAYLQVAAEFGWPAAAALCGGVVWGLAALARRVSQVANLAAQRLGIACFVTLAAVSMDALLSGNLVMPVPQVWVFVAIGLAWGWHRDTQPGGRAEVPGGPWDAAVVSALVVGLAALCMASAWEFSQTDVQLIESQWRSQTAHSEFSPRFWRNGWF